MAWIWQQILQRDSPRLWISESRPSLFAVIRFAALSRRRRRSRASTPPSRDIGARMPYKFFDNLLDTTTGKRRGKRKLTLPVSIGIHVIVLAAVLVVPLLSLPDLPEPVMSSAIRAFLVEAAPPPPPPPPPPAAAAPRPMTVPKIQQPKPVTEVPKF